MTTATFVDYYDILSLPTTADEEQIQQAVRSQRRLWNKRAGQSDAVQRSTAEQRIRDLAEAERVLLNTAARKAYDATRSENKARATADAETAGSSAAEVGIRDWLAEARRFYAINNAHAANYAAREAIAMNGADHEAWNIRANSSFILGEYRDAGFEFREAIRLQPQNAAYHFDYGEAHAAVGDWSAALAQYEIALRQDSDNPVYKIAIVNVYLNTDRAQKALAIAEEVVAAHPEVEVFQYYLALALHDANLEKLTRARGGYMITSPQQIAITREMAGRALKLNFHDKELSDSLKENLALADQAEKIVWTPSEHKMIYFVGIVIGVVMFSGFGMNAFLIGLLGILLVAGVPFLYVKRHRMPLWQFNASRAGITSNGGQDAGSDS